MSLDTQAVVAGFKKKPVVFIGGTLSVLLLLVVYFRSGLEAERQAAFEQKEAEATRYRNNVTNSGQLNEQLETLLVTTREIEARVIRPDQVAKNLQYFYRIEAELGITYVDLALSKVGAQTKGARYVPVTYRVSARGSYEQIITFVRRLENGSVFTRITSMQANGSRDSVTVALSVDLLGMP